MKKPMRKLPKSKPKEPNNQNGDKRRQNTLNFIENRYLNDLRAKKNYNKNVYRSRKSIDK